MKNIAIMPQKIPFSKNWFYGGAIFERCSVKFEVGQLHLNFPRASSHKTWIAIYIYNYTFCEGVIVLITR